MSEEEAIRLIARLVDTAADWQRGVSLGRRTKTAEEKTRKSVRAAFKQLTGDNPTDEQVEEMLRNVGLI